MQIRSYVVRFDCGFAPNPFGGYLTLATCKPRIRKHANRGDLIVGTGSAQSVGSNRLVYAGIVSQVVPIEDYGSLEEFTDKRPFFRGEDWKRFGDNCYFKRNGEWVQRQNPFHGSESQSKDLSGENVLICDQFWYYGRKAIVIPKRFHGLIKAGPGHKIIGNSDPLTARFASWLNEKSQGRHGYPVLATSPDDNATCGCKNE